MESQEQEQEQKKKTSFIFDLDQNQQELLLGIMLHGNYRYRDIPYSLWSIDGNGFNATLYDKKRRGKRKLCVQGLRAEDFVLFELEPKVLGGAYLGYEKVMAPELFSPHIGSDESGKGDYFGPLVVCSAYTDEELSDKMIELGVKDCKQMSDKAVLTTGAKLRALLGPDRYSVVKLGNAAYNRVYAKMRNVNRLLAWAHGTAIEQLLDRQTECNRVVVDQFAASEEVILKALKTRGRKAQVDQYHKAESDIAVAAASVIAREVFLRDMLKMGEEMLGRDADGAVITMPLGSSDPRVREIAEKMVRKHGPIWLLNYTKTHFQTTDKVLEACGKSRAYLPQEGRITSAVKNGEMKGSYK